MRNITKFDNESLYKTHMGGGDSVLPNVCYISDVNEVNYGRKVKRIATWVIDNDYDYDIVLLNNCTNVKSVKINGVLTEPNENNQITARLAGTYVAEIEFKSNTVDVDLFNPLVNAFDDWDGYDLFDEFGLKEDQMLKNPTYVPSDNQQYLVSLNDDFFYGIVNFPVIAASGLETIIVPEGITELPDGVFFNSSKLKNIKLPDSITKIGFATVKYNSTPHSIIINIPKSLIEIPEYFIMRNYYAGENGDGKLIIPDKVKKISYCAFLDCWNITNLTLPASLETIEQCAFQGNNISEITCYATTAPSIGQYTFHSNPKNGVLKVPTGATGYDAWLTRLGSGWTIEYI